MPSRHGISRREMLKYMGVAAVGTAGGAFLSGCGSSASPTSVSAPVKTPTALLGASGKPLAIATVGGTWKDWQDECVAQPFTKETGVKCVWDVMESASIVAAMIAAKKANATPNHHISKMDEDTVQFAGQTGLTSKLDMDIVTNWKDIHPNFRTDSWMTNHLSVFCMTWNSDKIKKPIASWFDMWDDSFKGKLAIPLFEWAGYRYYCGLNHILGGTPQNLDPVFKKLNELVTTLQPKIMNSVEHGNQLFTSGEIWIAPFWDGRTRNLQDQKLPISYLYPKEGAMSNGSGFVIDRDLAENYRDANVFMQKVGDPEAQVCFASKINYPPTNLKAKLPPSLERLKINQDDMDRMLRVDWAAYQNSKSDFLDRWNREIAARIK